MEQLTSFYMWGRNTFGEEEKAFLLTMLDQMFQSPKSNTNVTLFT